MKKCSKIVTLFLFSAAILLSGCETLKGTGRGLWCSAQEVASGIKQDAAKAYHFLQAADAWTRKNFW